MQPIDFFAKPITTKLTWNDLDLPKDTLSQIHEIEKWIKYSDSLLENSGLRNKIKPGHRALFYGPPGTGKTITAALLGKYNDKDVYSIDLSLVVSKYIGETEKNLATLFDKAENGDWILFFDEADALFGKRTNISDANDRYANQATSYLMQRMELYKGLIILATSAKDSIDEKFIRRLNTVIYFPDTNSEEK